MTNQPTNEKLDQATALLDLCNRLADQTVQHARRLDNLEGAIRAMNEAQRRHEVALDAMRASVETLAVRVCGPGVLTGPEAH